jgi:uncharacterized membrane protein YhaH (DUF805 family)
MFTLFNCLVSIAFALVAGFVGRMLGLGQDLVTKLALVYSLAVLIPSLAVWVRRMHDTGRTGWWLLVVLVPFIGVIALLVFSVQDSQPGTNAYGKNPKTAFA